MVNNVLRWGELAGLVRSWRLLGPPNASLLEALFPSLRLPQRLLASLVLVGVLVALGRARFYLPENPVPITFQTFGVLAMGGVLGWRWGLFSILLYYFLGMAGLPVFQGGGNGWHYVSASPTGGYLIGFIAAVALVGFLSQRGWHHSRVLWPMLLANLAIYLPGLLWLGAYGFVPWDSVFSKGMYPFIPGDLVKLMLASIAVGFGWTVADHRRRRVLGKEV
jgi:biotin transport system substrate-specific component